jgi:type IV pilus assembly protein PilV
MTRTFLYSTPTPSAGAGFALLEVLICILVLAVGLIGAAMMQLHATRTTEQSSLHDTALALAMQIADELRANDAQMRLPNGANPFLTFQYTVPATPGAGMSAGPNCYLQSCSPAQLAAQSLRDWQSRADLVLRAGGRIEICRDPNIASPGTTQLNWCNGASGAATTVPVAIKIGWKERDADGKNVADLSPRIAVLVSPYAP